MYYVNAVHEYVEESVYLGDTVEDVLDLVIDCELYVNVVMAPFRTTREQVLKALLQQDPDKLARIVR